jgi:hypothetical protein
MRMIVARRVARDFGALGPCSIGAQVQVVHRDQNAPLGGLQSVTRIGKRTADNDGHRIGEIALLHLIPDGNLLNVPGTRYAVFAFGIVFGSRVRFRVAVSQA